MHSYFHRGMIMRVSNSAITQRGYLVLKATKTALVVRSVLLLNEAVFGSKTMEWLKAGLRYCMPLSVFLCVNLSQN